MHEEKRDRCFSEDSDSCSDVFTWILYENNISCNRIRSIWSKVDFTNERHEATIKIDEETEKEAVTSLMTRTLSYASVIDV